MKRKISNTQNPETRKELSHAKVDSFDLASTLVSLCDTEDETLLSVNDNLATSAHEQELLNISLKFDSDRNELLNSYNKDLLNLFSRAIAEKVTKTCYKIINTDLFDVNTKDEKNNTALHYSSKHGEHQITSLLIDRGADLTVRNFNQLTPLHLSIVFNHNKNTEILLNAAKESNLNEIIANQPDQDGNTALHYATQLYYAKENKNPEAINFLLENGADLMIKNHNQKTPLDLAVALSNKNSGFYSRAAS